jgi:hypothetical protein
MKTSLTKLSSSILLLVSLSAWAKPVAQVTEVSGTVFVVTPEGKTQALKNNQHLEERTDVLVEEDATITLNDYFDATYHLAGGTHLTFFNKSVQLKKGKVWIQSAHSRHPLALTTANGHVDFWKGEFIVTFDQTHSRSQVLVVNGDVEVSNVLDRSMKQVVSAGSFTLIDPEVENGLPRAPTKVGLSSLNSAIAEFKKMPTREAPSRAIASVNEAPVKKGEIIFISSNRMPASVGQGSAHKYYKKMVGKRVQHTPVPIKVYGVSFKKMENSQRVPASIQPLTPVPPKKAGATLKIDPEFDNSLKKEFQTQPKYPKELERLIDDLKSY